MRLLWGGGYKYHSTYTPSLYFCTPPLCRDQEKQFKSELEDSGLRPEVREGGGALLGWRAPPRPI